MAVWLCGEWIVACSLFEVCVLHAEHPPAALVPATELRVATAGSARSPCGISDGQTPVDINSVSVRF